MAHPQIQWVRLNLEPVPPKPSARGSIRKGCKGQDGGGRCQRRRGRLSQRALVSLASCSSPLSNSFSIFPFILYFSATLSPKLLRCPFVYSNHSATLLNCGGRHRLFLPTALENSKASQSAYRLSIAARRTSSRSSKSSDDSRQAIELFLKRKKKGTFNSSYRSTVAPSKPVSISIIQMCMLS